MPTATPSLRMPPRAGRSPHRYPKLFALLAGFQAATELRHRWPASRPGCRLAWFPYLLVLCWPSRLRWSRA